MIEDKDSKLGYMVLKLYGIATRYTIAWSPYEKSINLYFDVDNFIEYIQAIFENPERIKNYDCISFVWVIEVRKFSDFYIDFKHNSFLLNIDQDVFICDLK